MGVVTTGEVARTYWWLVLVRGIVALLFGIVAVGWTHIAILFLIYLLGAYFLIDGIMGVILAFQERPVYSRWWLILIGGIIGIILAFAVFFWPGGAALVLTYLIAAWAVITGIIAIIAAFFVSTGFGREWSLVVGGALSVILGIIVFFIPVTAILAFVWLLGVFAIIYGIVLLVRAFQFRALLKA